MCPRYLSFCELSGIARHVAHSADGSKLALELATSLLFVENALDQITRLPAHFSERADEITARLLSVVSGDEPQSQAAWMGEISREAQQRQTMTVLVSEIQTSLRQVEKHWTNTSVILRKVNLCIRSITCCIRSVARWRFWIRMRRCKPGNDQTDGCYIGRLQRVV
jgi:hypothetical protein